MSGKTLIPGGPVITVNNIPLSLLPLAAAIVMTGSQTPLAAAPLATSAPAVTAGNTTEAPFAFHESVYTANSEGNYVCGSKTIILGGPTTHLFLSFHLRQLFSSEVGQRHSPRPRFLAEFWDES